MAKMNKERRGRYMIYKNNGSSHFMNGESTVHMFRTLIAEAFDLRRRSLKLHGHKGMLLADAFSGNASKREGLAWAFQTGPLFISVGSTGISVT